MKGLPYIKFLINVFGKYGEDHDFIHTVNKEIQNVSNTVFNINNLKSELFLIMRIISLLKRIWSQTYYLI